MRKIAIEEHFSPQIFEEYMQRQVGRSRTLPPQITAWMQDVGEKRLRDLDEAGIAMQVLSLKTPGLERVPAEDARELAREINDELAGIIRQQPERFAGFAALPTLDPRAAAAELERSVQHLGLKGAMIHGQPAGGVLEDSTYWDIFAAAEALDVPLYLHPSTPAPEALALYQGSPELVGPLWSFTVESATQAMRMIVSGLFDRFPGLTIILGHLGETLPYLLERLDSRWQANVGGRARELPSHYLRTHFLVTTSGIFSDAALRCAISALGAERVLFAVDYPYEPNKTGTAWLDAASLTQEERQLIAHRNAERWLRL